MYRRKISHIDTLVVIDDFDTISAIFSPFEADSPLLINADGVLA